AGPTDTLTPRTASETTGKSVPQNTTERIPRKSQLFIRKLASRETTDSSRWLLRSAPRLWKTALKEAGATATSKRRKRCPNQPAAVNECTDETTPLRVRKVPNRHKQ